MRLSRVSGLLLAALAALSTFGAQAARGDAFGTPALVLSPDGRSAYASANALLVLRRDPGSGALTVVRELPGAATTLELSPDGRWLFAAGRHAGPSIRAYARDTETGELRLAGEVSSGRLGIVDLALSRDGRVLLASQPGESALIAFSRDPESGGLGPPRRQAAEEPGALTLAGDGRTLYYGGPAAVVRAQVTEAGEWRTVDSTYCPCGRPESIALAPDGTRLYAGPHGYGAFARDPQMGALSPLRRPDQDFGAGYPRPAQGLEVARDGSALFGVDRRDARLFVARRTEEGTAPLAEVREGTGGAQGLTAPAGVILAPDGRHLYVTGGGRASDDPGSIAVFEHDESSHALTFRSLLRGPSELGTISPATRPAELLIDGGARYASDRGVQLTLRAAPPRSGFRVWNAGDEEQALELSPSADDRYAWRLPDGAPEGVPLTVHAKVLGDGAHAPLVASIVLDATDPRIVAARAARTAGRLRLTVTARDRTSGVARVQVAVRGKRPRAWQR
ncbi:MAG: lactonase family protein, partial [Actinomycetota bacterium]|nr:lactonase family protein [Actinomycetota bacterium]